MDWQYYIRVGVKIRVVWVESEGVAKDYERLIDFRFIHSDSHDSTPDASHA